MTLLALIGFFLVAGCLFPSSGQSYHAARDALASFITGVVVLAFIFLWWILGVWAITSLAEWLGVEPSSTGTLFIVPLALLGPIVLLMLIGGTIQSYLSRRRTNAPTPGHP